MEKEIERQKKTETRGNSWKRRETCERIYKSRENRERGREMGMGLMGVGEGDKRGAHAKKPTSSK